MKTITMIMAGFVFLSLMFVGTPANAQKKKKSRSSWGITTISTSPAWKQSPLINIGGQDGPYRKWIKNSLFEFLWSWHWAKADWSAGHASGIIRTFDSHSDQKAVTKKNVHQDFWTHGGAPGLIETKLYGKADSKAFVKKGEPVEIFGGFSSPTETKGVRLNIVGLEFKNFKYWFALTPTR